MVKVILNINIRTIPHKKQRYETVGDWIWSNIKERLDRSKLTIKVSDMGDWRMEFLVAFHEQIETVLCSLRNIKQRDVDNFDKEFESRRVSGNCDEPGDDPNAPYYKEHQFATKLERMLAKELGLNWEEYEAKINSL